MQVNRIPAAPQPDAQFVCGNAIGVQGPQAKTGAGSQRNPQPSIVTPMHASRRKG